ncbi:Holo-[acyl-carrier-protein] synthase [Actinomyces bovis]|uniref:Holo-[acyl-carrier-protein] synthase n=1 Tax=Actinomyces bovis TaxID=1658 RepID=A0ABY1VPH6_9ACTO|nr:holo-ACP synthase [Actinomyces bovis]SPT54030.1 Holo-[acyl-carrier-protein] synthase [Actinomyces bovis]VEG53819.1 Holo-[acyl-carrier-protein] synthase [Actinomyces israelii]
MQEPQLPQLPAEVAGVGLDLVNVPALAHQLTIPGTVFAERAFTARELREAVRRSDERGSLQAEHLAARWAAKEAFIKAWSQAINQQAGHSVPPVIAPEAVNWQEIEVINDRWRRPSLRLSGQVAGAVAGSLGQAAAEGSAWLVSLTHDGDWAVAIVLAPAS